MHAVLLAVLLAMVGADGALKVVCSDIPTEVTEREGYLYEHSARMYENNMDCSITLRPTKHAWEEVVVTFDQADVVEGDNLLIYTPAESVVPSEVLTGRFQGSVVRTREASVRLRFVSDGERVGSGYRARFEVPCTEGRTCGGTGYCSGVGCRCFDGWGGWDCGAEQECTGRVRRSWYSLGTAERRLFQDGVKTLKVSGLFDIFSTIHDSRLNSRYAHGTSGFLPWHRQFIWEYENALRELGGRYKCLTVPYWAWELDAGENQRSSEMWRATPEGWGAAVTLANGTGCVDGVDGYYAGWEVSTGGCLLRYFERDPFPMEGESQVVDVIINNPTYGTTSGFRRELEGAPHSTPHLWIGGHMQSFRSPDDPVFFLHHCNVDRLWALWQDCHDHDLVHPQAITDTTYVAYRDGDLDTAMPFSLPEGEDTGRFASLQVTPRDVHSIVDMGYLYAADDGLASLATMQEGCGEWGWFRSSTARVGHPLAATPQGGLPHHPAARAYIASLAGKITPRDIHVAAVLECLAHEPGALPEEWVAMEFGEGYSTADFPSVCHDLLP